MMIQTATSDNRRFISTMLEHLDLCHQFVLAFGNDEFEDPIPHEEFIYTVKYHDRRWDDFDRKPSLNEIRAVTSLVKERIKILSEALPSP